MAIIAEEIAGRIRWRRAHDRPGKFGHAPGMVLEQLFEVRTYNAETKAHGIAHEWREVEITE